MSDRTSDPEPSEPSSNDAPESVQLSQHASGPWFQQLVANSSDIITVLDDQTNLIYANPASAKLFGYEPGSRTGRNVLELIHPDDHVLAATRYGEVMERGGTIAPMVLRIFTSSGKWLFLELVLTNCLDDPAIRGIVANGHDVTERIYLTRALLALAEGHKVLVNASEEAGLLKGICDSLVNIEGILLAWVGFVEYEEADFVRPVASSGLTEFLNETNLSWSENEFERGLIGDVVRTRSVKVLDDVRGAVSRTPWWNQAEKFGLLSSCSFPLLVDGEAIGTLTLHSNEVGFFGRREVELFADLASELSYGIGRLRDVERLARQEKLLRDSEERFRLAFESNTAPMIFSDLDDCVIAVNNAFINMTGYTREELMSRDSKQFTHPDDVGITEDSRERLISNEIDQLRYVKRYLHKNGREIISEVSRSPARDSEGKILYFVASERDITEERTLAAQLSHQALHDPLTGLANRSLFEDRLEQAHARAARLGGNGAIFLLDLDDFKGVNDTRGHLAGDELLVAVARRLEGVTRASDTLCRFGGDEFLYLAEDLSSAEEADHLAQRLLDVFVEPFVIAGKTHGQNLSIGVAVWDGTQASPSELIRDADIALYEAKSQGKGRYVAFTQRMHLQAVTRYELTRDLRAAVELGQLSMRYQPIVELATRDVVGFESLMRWYHPTRGLVSPDQFIPLAEESDLILEIGEFALREAVKDASSWKCPQTRAGEPYVTVNVSARQFLAADFLSMVDEALREYDFNPERLIVEITEGVALLDGQETLDVVGHLRERKIAIALDDFGTGYSSFSYLTALHPRLIKIDKSFVSPVVESTQNDVLLETIVSLGCKLNLTMLAEGVETPAQLERVRELGCDLAQGELFSHPLVKSDVGAFLENAGSS